MGTILRSLRGSIYPRLGTFKGGLIQVGNGQQGLTSLRKLKVDPIFIKSGE